MENNATMWMCDWSENGTLIGCVYFDSHVNVYNATDGRLVRSLDIPQQTTRCDGFLPSGIKYPTRYLDFSPDGRFLAVASDDHNGYVFWTSNWTLYKRISGNTAAVLCVQFSPDSSLLLTGTGFEKVIGTGPKDVNVTKVWDLSTGECKATLNDQENGSIISMIYSPSGRQFAVNSDDKTICIYNATTFKLDRRLVDGHITGGVLDSEWSPDEKRMVSGSRDYSAVVWDLENGTYVKYTHDNCVRCARWDKQGKYFITSGIEMTARLYDPAKGQPMVTFTEGVKYDSNVMASKFSPDGSRFVSALGKSRYLIMYWQKEPAPPTLWSYFMNQTCIGIYIFTIVSMISLYLIVIRPMMKKMHRRRG